MPLPPRQHSTHGFSHRVPTERGLPRCETVDQEREIEESPLRSLIKNETLRSIVPVKQEGRIKNFTSEVSWSSLEPESTISRAVVLSCDGEGREFCA